MGQTIMKHQYIKTKRGGREERKRIYIKEGAKNLTSDSGAYNIKEKERGRDNKKSRKCLYL
jgi:hypothetical protein